MRELGRLALLTLVSNAVAQLSCRFGGSSDSSDEQSECMVCVNALSSFLLARPAVSRLTDFAIAWTVV